MLDSWNEIGRKLTAMAEDFPEDKYDFQPTPAQRSFAEQLLQDSAIENVQHWTFVKPPTAPYTEVVVYDYEADPSLPPSGGAKRMSVITKVLFDLPDHVRILTNVPINDANKSKFQP